MPMAAMKPRTGDGPLEVTKEGRGIVMRVPLEGGGRLVVELNAEEAKDLGDQLVSVGELTSVFGLSVRWSLEGRRTRRRATTA